MSEQQIPGGLLGLHHVALQTPKFEETRRFYVNLFGMRIEWEPDADNVYLTGGTDNLALHRTTEDADSNQRVDHVGFIVADPHDVDAWFEHLVANKVEIVAEPRTHRDGARSFYCVDPAGVTVQVIYHPPLSDQKATL